MEGELTTDQDTPDIPAGTFMKISGDGKKHLVIALSHVKDGTTNRVKFRSTTRWERIKFFFKQLRYRWKKF